MSIPAQTVIMDGNDQQQLVYYSNYHPTHYIITLKSDLPSRQYRTIGDQWKDGISPNHFPSDWLPKMELPSGGYTALIKKYEDAVNTQASHETLFKKIKKKTVDGTNNPEMKIIPAKTIIRETGFHPDILCENPHKSPVHPDGYVVNDYVGHPLDPGSPLDSDSLMMSDIINIQITPRFLELFGFPSNIQILINRSASTQELFNVSINIGSNSLSGTFIRSDERGVTKWIPGGDLGEFLINPGVSNKIKNKAYLTADILTQQRILLIKELGDFLQVLLYFICFLWETTGPNPIDILDWKKNHSMITTDSVVYNLCKDFDLQCTYTGSTESLMSGECTLYRYLPVDLNLDDCKTAYNNMVQYYIQEVIDYNTHIKFALNKIQLATTYTWGIPFMNSDGTLIIIDGFSIQHLSTRAEVNGQPSQVIIGRLRSLIHTYNNAIYTFNITLSQTQIDDSQITIENFKQEIDRFKQQPLLEDNRTKVILTSEGVVSQITNRIVSKIYYPSPGSDFYNNICSILLNGRPTITYQIGRSTPFELTPLNDLSDALRIVLNNFTKEASMKGGMFGYSSSTSYDGINSSESDSSDVSSEHENDDESISMDDDDDGYPAGFYDENDSHEVRDLYTYLQYYVNYIIINTSISITDIVTFNSYEYLCLFACMTYDFNLINPPERSIPILQIRIPVYKYVSDENDIMYNNIDETTYWDSHTDSNMVVVGKKRKTPKPKKKSESRRNKVINFVLKPISILRKRFTSQKPPKGSISKQQLVNPYIPTEKLKYAGGKRTKKRNKTKSKPKSSKKQKTSSRRTRKRHHKIK